MQRDYWYELNDKVAIGKLEDEVSAHLDNFLEPVLKTVNTLRGMNDFMTANADLKQRMSAADHVLLLLRLGDRDSAERILRDE